MAASTPLLTTHRWHLLIALFIALTSLYLLTYTGQIESGDTLALFDSSESLVYFGDTLLDKSAWFNTRLLLTTNNGYPLYDRDTEPLLVFLASPLIWLADKLPQVGLVHAAWLFNVLICAAVCAELFLFALVLGYTERTAIIAALALGILTIFWPYSRTFFREPLATFMVLTAALCIERWRASCYRSWWFLGLSILAVVGGLLTKEAIIFTLPALVIIIFPALPIQRLHRLVGGLLIILLLLVALFAGFSVLANHADFTPLYTQIGSWIGRDAAYIQTIHVAMHSYLLSVGGSVWGTSPVVLLVLPGLWMLYRRRQYRYIVAIIAVTGAFILGYAYLREIHWFGGLSWPPRFLIPVVPFLMLGTLPIIEVVFKQPANRVLRWSVILLFACSFWVQLSGVSLPWGAYNAALPPEAGGLSEWGGGLNTLQYLRWVLLPQRWGQQPLDFAWVRTGAWLWPIGFTLFFIYALVEIARLLKGVSPKNRLRTLALPVALLLMTWLGLRSIYFDPIYLGDRLSLRGILPLVESQTREGDILLLNNNTYERFMLNYAKWRSPRVITLPPQPGEQLQPPLYATTPDTLLVKSSVPLIHNVMHSRDHIWLLADSGPWIASSIRPVERFLVTHYYPIQELTTDPPDPAIRLIEYSTVNAPKFDSFRNPDILTDLHYGDSIQLSGFSLPLGRTYRPDTALPISLYWRTDAALDRDYTVAWFLTDETGTPVAQGADYQPQWGFAPTSQWHVGVPVWDNRALWLPPDLKPGLYQLAVVLYALTDSGEISNLPVSGTAVIEDRLGMLPVQIEIVN